MCSHWLHARILTCVHYDVSHLWCHLGNHTGTNSLGKLFHHNLSATTSVWLMYPNMDNEPKKHVLRPDTCSLGPNPDDTSTILALILSLGGVLFSLSSWPSDGELQFFGVLAAEPSVLGATVLLTHNPEKKKSQLDRT